MTETDVGPSVHVDYRTEGDVVIVTTANPPAEVASMELISGVRRAVERATAEGVRAMVIKSDARLFSGGADVNMFKDKDIHQAKAMFTEGMRTIAALEDAPFPVIAAVQGLCYAAGLELALACDFIYASEDAVFSQVEAFIGATTFLGGVYRLAERCGPAIAREIVYTADDYSAQQFADWHIVNKVVPRDELHSTVLSLAKRIAAGPKLAHATTKRLVRHALAHGSRSTDEVLLHDATWLLPSQDMQNAVSRLVEVGARRFRATRDETFFEGR